MTERDTLLDIAVYCAMWKRGIADGETMMERIVERVKPHLEEESDMLMEDDCLE